MDYRIADTAMAVVYNAIGVGRENATSRQELAKKTGMPDRAVRKAIEMLRHERPILSVEGGRGYYIPRTNAQGRSEAARWIERQNRRIASIRKAQNGARRFAQTEKKEKQCRGQISFFGGGYSD